MLKYELGETSGDQFYQTVMKKRMYINTFSVSFYTLINDDGEK